MIRKVAVHHTPRLHFTSSQVGPHLRHTFPSAMPVHIHKASSISTAIMRLPRAAILYSGQYRAHAIRASSPAINHRLQHHDADAHGSNDNSSRDPSGDLIDTAGEHSIRSSAHAPRRVPFVPFERPADPLRESLANATTLTKTERNLFRVLGSNRPSTRSGRTTSYSKHTETETETESLTSALDDILDGAVESYTEQLQPAQKELDDLQQAKEDSNIVVKTPKQIAADMRRDEEYNTIVAILDKAETDAKLWSELHTQVVGPIVALDLDIPSQVPPQSSTPGNAAKRKRATQRHLEVKGPNLSRLVVAATDMFVRKFPLSHYISAIIPTLKSAGPSVFALGISTDLYNAVLAHIFEADCDLPTMLEFLDDMEQNIIIPDHDTIEILQRVQDHARLCAAGTFDVAVKNTWATGRYARAVRELGLRQERMQEGRDRARTSDRYMDHNVRHADDGAQE